MEIDGTELNRRDALEREDLEEGSMVGRRPMSFRC